ncbi:Transposable element Tc3 transposase-like 4 [Homarus americanus]|uniref:Transposable element Tc3 transposase-like 4 n=1 Tax=Homarus americanus TaxID=6706 RepID=A0A8J5KLM1_HOMAM|nr:Transposable element Tc3 transposase-like 4 [Homarus americanus]
MDKHTAWDNSPIHTTGIIRRWFDKQPDIQLLEWLSKGCDLNPIGNVWGAIVRSWETGGDRTPQQLLQYMKDEWQPFSQISATNSV